VARKRLERIETIAELTDPERDWGGISRIRRFTVCNHYVGGEVSRTYKLDVVDHRGQDAVGVLPYWRRGGETHVMLLKSFRPAQTFRVFGPLTDPMVIEIIAGVLEDGENNEAGVVRRAVAELEEEAGIVAAESDIRLLGKPFFASPGLFTEMLWVAAVEIDPDRLGTPSLDGSVMEELIESFSVPLEKARQMCLDGDICDGKTEIALERFARLIGG
jgi:8-oxo-dGTP pyrophosphatase MutT (NUDIX family)